MPLSRRVGQKPLEADALRLKTWTGGQVPDPLITRDIVPEATDAYDIGSSTLLFRKGWLSELEAIVFAQNTIQLLGGWFIIGHGEGTVNEDVDTSETQIDFGAGGGLAQNDFVLFRAVGKVEYMQIGANVSGNVWNVTRNLDGTGANSWPKGSPYLNLGYNGDGSILLNANDTPRISMSTQGTAYNSTTELIRTGDLDGNWGYAAETYGFAVGEYGAAKANVTVDVANGVRIRDNTTTMVELTPAGVVNIGAQASNYVKISGGIIYFYNGATLEGTLSGSTWTLGELSNSYVAITPGGITLYDSSEKDRLVVEAGQVTVGDSTEGEYVRITSGGIAMYGGGVVHLGLSSAGTFWAGDTSATERIQWDVTNGLQIFNASNAAVFKAPTSGDIQIVGTLEVTSPGEITAAGGNVTIDANGIRMHTSQEMKWFSSGVGLGDTLTIDYSSGYRITGYGAVAYPNLTIAGFSNIILGSAVTSVIRAVGDFAATKGVTFNESGADSDTRIESDTNTHAFFLDAGNSRIGINNSGPGYALDVTGSIAASATIRVGTGLYVGSTSIAPNAGTITVDQGAADTKILQVKSSDVAHGMTDIAETDTYGYFEKAGANDGGLTIVGLRDTGTQGLIAAGIAPTDNTTKTTAGTGYV